MHLATSGSTLALLSLISAYLDVFLAKGFATPRAAALFFSSSRRERQQQSGGEISGGGGTCTGWATQSPPGAEWCEGDPALCSWVARRRARGPAAAPHLQCPPERSPGLRPRPRAPPDMALGAVRAAAQALLLLLLLLLPAHAASRWGPWSPCRRCQQSRRQLCQPGADCGSLWLEVRGCPGRRCPQPRLRVRAASPRPPGSERNFRVLHHLQSLVYSDWSGWSPCSSDCRTRRQRLCKMPLVCGKAILHEDALCYIRGSPCEARFAPGESQGDHDGGKVGSCGVPRSPQRPALRIIGGQPAARGRWPWQVAILNRRREPFCGGTLVAPGWVLTAAHCLRRKLHVLAGEHSLGKTEGSELTVRVAEAIAHPDYDPETVDMDLALLRLRSALPLGPYVLPACLPEQGDSPAAGALATILGWGKLSKRHANGSDLLHQAQVPLVPAAECRAVYADYLISDNMLCAGFRRGRVDSCAGDSGGPLLARDEHGRWTVFGVTSFGEGCGRQGRFGIYAKVANAARWLRRTMAGSRP